MTGQVEPADAARALSEIDQRREQAIRRKVFPGWWWWAYAVLIVEFAEEDQAENLARLKQLGELMADLGFGWDQPKRRWGGVVEITEPSLQTAIAEFRAAYPDVELTLAEGEPEEIIPRLRAGELDLALLFEFDGQTPLRQTARPVGTVLVIDTSGSMKTRGALDQAKAAAHQFIAGRGPNEWTAIVSFSSAPQVRSNFTQDAAALGAAIDSLQAVGETALWDGLTTAAHLYDQRPDLQPNVVLLSDGADSISSGNEAQATGDLNGDSLPDYAIKLVEDKPEKNSEGDPTERGRALVIALSTKDGKLQRAGVADRLLQCTRCGGAFYGVVESPANVSIEKGIVVVEQDHGSRDLSDTTYRFRYEPTTQRFVLIGFDFSDVDRLTASGVTESTNYLTGIRITTRGKGNRDTKTRSVVQKKIIYLEEAAAEDLEGAALKRLHLD